VVERFLRRCLHCGVNCVPGASLWRQVFIVVFGCHMRCSDRAWSPEDVDVVVHASEMSRRMRLNKAIHCSSLGLTFGLADLGSGYFVPLPIAPTTFHVWNVTSTINDQPAQPCAPPTNGHNGPGVFYPPWWEASKSSGNRLWYSAKIPQPAGSDRTATTIVPLRRFTHFDGQSCPTSVSQRLPGGLC
jgi:hypothetical protein